MREMGMGLAELVCIVLLFKPRLKVRGWSAVALLFLVAYGLGALTTELFRTVELFRMVRP